MICDKCKKKIKQGIRKDGLPNAIGFELEDGKEIILCKECLDDLGSRNEKEKQKFLDELNL